MDTTLKNQTRIPDNFQTLLRTLRVEPLVQEEDISHCQALLAEDHYLGAIEPVGERLYYSVRAQEDQWLGVFVFTAAARRLRPRDQWIGWNDEQRRRRLALVANNARFLLLPEMTVPNLGSAALARVLDRLSEDWQARYGHPILVVESFVNPELFCGTVYTAAGFEEVGFTQGNGRICREYYEPHGKPKRLFVRALRRDACRSLQAEKLKPSLAEVEAKVPPRCTQNTTELVSLKERFKQVPEYHKQMCYYPVYALLAIMAAAHLADPPKGQKDLATFASRLSQSQRRALGVRRNPKTGRYPAPSQSTFSRMMSAVDIDCVEQLLLDWQKQVRGEPAAEDLVVLDGKVPKHSGGKNVVTAITASSQHYLGCEIVPDKTNEITAVRTLFKRLDLDGKTVSIDAIHTQTQTAQELVLEHGADYMLTVKNNQPGLRAQIERLVSDPSDPLFFSRSSPIASAAKKKKRGSR